MAKPKTGKNIRCVVDYVAYLRGLQIDRGREFANAVTLANDRFGVPIGIIAGSKNGDECNAARWKQARSLPEERERAKVVTRICEYLGHPMAP